MSIAHTVLNNDNTSFNLSESPFVRSRLIQERLHRLKDADPEDNMQAYWYKKATTQEPSPGVPPLSQDEVYESSWGRAFPSIVNAGLNPFTCSDKQTLGSIQFDDEARTRRQRWALRAPDTRFTTKNGWPVARNKEVWVLHTDGLSYEKIADTLGMGSKSSVRLAVETLTKRYLKDCKSFSPSVLDDDELHQHRENERARMTEENDHMKASREAEERRRKAELANISDSLRQRLDKAAARKEARVERRKRQA